MKEAVVLIPTELFGQNVHGALLNTFPTDWKVEVYVVTNQIVGDFNEEFGTLFLDKYKKGVEQIVKKYLNTGVKFYVVTGGVAFLNVILIQKLIELVGADRIVLLVYRKFEKKYGAFRLDGRWFDIKAEALDKPALLGD
jgi:phosphoserine phosphatase